MGTPLYLSTNDIGNVNTKYRLHGGAWAIEPSLVRMAPEAASFSFLTDEPPIRPLVYVSGPAQIAPIPYLVGRAAEQAGASDVPIIGSAEVRVRSTAYLLMHCYAVLASLPAGVTEAQIAFAGGVPMTDYLNSSVVEVLKQRLKGTHQLTWGGVPYRITIEKTAIMPQPIGGIASLIFSPEGKILANGALARQRFGLDIGGGTTDYTGRIGLKAIDGSEGGVAIGIQTAAAYACTHIQRRFPRLRHLDAARVLACLRQKTTTIHVAGELVDVSEEIQAGLRQAADDILAHVLPRWQRRLAEGEVLLYGGGGEDLAGPISSHLSPLTRVTLLPNPLTRVVEGIERMAKYQMQVQQ